MDNIPYCINWSGLTMAKSRALKKREHRLRNRKGDLTKSRGGYIEISTHERVTKTKQELLVKNETKHKKRSSQHQHVDDGCFYVFRAVPFSEYGSSELFFLVSPFYSCI